MLPHSPFSPLGNQCKYLSVLSITEKSAMLIDRGQGAKSSKGGSQKATGGKRLKNCPVKSHFSVHN